VFWEITVENWTKEIYLKRIGAGRSHGKISEAIDIALEAIEKYPDENVFEKILGDLYLQNNNNEAAGTAYINFLKKIGDNQQYIRHFARFMQRYSAIVQDLNAYILMVEQCLDDTAMNGNIVITVCEIISHYIEYPQIELFKSDKHFKKAVQHIREIESSWRLYILFYKVLSISHSEQNKRIDKHVVSSMEKKKRYAEALILINEVLRYDKDQVAVRTLFRICRKLEDYSEAEKYIAHHPELKKQGQFNILYEFVFYYSKIGDVEERNKALEKIEICGRESIPILRTLYNFYLQFGMLEKAVEIKAQITQAQPSKKQYQDRRQQEDDSAEALLRTIQEMNVELEHSRKLISMSELLKGFSHELGQPMIAATAILYSTKENPLLVVTSDKALRVAMTAEGMEFIVPGTI